MSSYSQIVAVLTGDVVASRKAGTDATDQAFRILAKTASELSEIADADTRFTRFRGDGWQLILGRAGWVLRACLMITADLRASGLGIETRISAGLGRYDTFGTANLSDATGPAFVISGHHLDLAPKRRRLLVAGGRTSDQLWQSAVFDLIEHQTAGWTASQAETVAIKLRTGHLTHAEIADRLAISRQAVQIRLAGAGYSALESALAAFEHLEGDRTDG